MRRLILILLLLLPGTAQAETSGVAPTNSSQILQPAQTSGQAVGSSDTNFQIQSNNSLQAAPNQQGTLQLLSSEADGLSVQGGPTAPDSSTDWLGWLIIGVALAVGLGAGLIIFRHLSKSTKKNPKQ